MALLLLSGCNKDKAKVETPVKTESVDIENTKEETELEEEEPLDTSPTEEEKKENSSGQTENPDTKSEEKTENSTPVVENSTQENTNNSHKEEKPSKENVEVSKPIVHYNPNTIVQLATNKLKAIGKVTLTDNLDRLLAEGSITQEEYNEYYPYDGAGYYSVFMEVNLEDAKTTSGRRLKSEDEIAQYIADMLAVENGPYFLIEYAGIYTTGGNDFYEFRCYRA